jgi:2,4-dienoyl-CoA reductase-like NADH-dependent reductase (Old Yellow Enzyme family)/thioredoxin reductase
MNELKYPNLFKPIRLGGTLFKNRLFASPTGVRDFTAEDFMTEDGFAYYERKALGGAASVCIGECAVDSLYGRHGSPSLVLDNPKASNSYCRLTTLISRHGAVASAELMHAGWAANGGDTPPGPAFAPVETFVHGRTVPAMPEEIIERTIGAFADAAAFAKRCGFGMVTIHAGHGWMLHQFMSPFTNTRKDKWGGPSVENRMRLPLAIVDAIRKKVGPTFPIEIRISGSECYDGGYGIDEGIAFAKLLDDKVDLIHVSAGNYSVDEVFTVTHPSLFLEDGCNVKYAAEIRKHVKTPVATVGALCDPELMEEIIASGKADVVEAARGLIADPDLPEKARAGRPEEIRKCLRCLNCFSDLLFRGQFYCAVNPELGHELEMRHAMPAPSKKKLLVVGGGVAGMQAALTAAQRGHDVILYEKSGRLGGVLRCEENAPFKKRLEEYLDYQAAQLRKAGVDIRLNTEVTPEAAKALEPDAVIAALGARPVIPDIPGIDGRHVLSAIAAYEAPDSVGGAAVILGGGLVGLELAIFLAQLGKKITVLEMTDRLNDGGNFLHMKGVGVQLKKYKIDIRLSTKALEITEKGVRGQSAGTGNGAAEQFYPADTVIYAVGMKPLQDEAAAFGGAAPEFHQVGDCLAAKNIMNATSAGFTAARDVGRVI